MYLHGWERNAHRIYIPICFHKIIARVSPGQEKPFLTISAAEYCGCMQRVIEFSGS